MDTLYTLKDDAKTSFGIVPKGLLFAPVRIIVLPLAIIANIVKAMRQNAEIKRRIKSGEIKL